MQLLCIFCFVLMVYWLGFQIVCRLLNAALALDSLCLISVSAPLSVIILLLKYVKVLVPERMWFSTLTVVGCLHLVSWPLYFVAYHQSNASCVYEEPVGFVLNVVMGVGEQGYIISKVNVFKCCEFTLSDASWNVRCCILRDPVEGYDKECWWHYTALTYSCFNIKLDAGVSNSASEVDIKTLDDTCNYLSDVVVCHTTEQFFRHSPYERCRRLFQN